MSDVKTKSAASDAPALTYSEMLEFLAEALEIPRGQITMFSARVRKILLLGAIPSALNGKGKLATYGVEDVVRLYTIVRLNLMGIGPAIGIPAVAAVAYECIAPGPLGRAVRIDIPHALGGGNTPVWIERMTV